MPRCPRRWAQLSGSPSTAPTPESWADVWGSASVHPTSSGPAKEDTGQARSSFVSSVLSSVFWPPALLTCSDVGPTTGRTDNSFSAPRSPEDLSSSQDRKSPWKPRCPLASSGLAARGDPHCYRDSAPNVAPGPCQQHVTWTSGPCRVQGMTSFFCLHTRNFLYTSHFGSFDTSGKRQASVFLFLLRSEKPGGTKPPDQLGAPSCPLLRPGCSLVGAV